MAFERSMGTRGRETCKICGAPAPLFGVVDFAKNCLEKRGLRLPLTGWPIYYRRCGACGFLFTTAFDRWSQADFAAGIYNEGYAQVDPDYAALRPRATAQVIVKLFGASADRLSLLDWGAGNARLEQELRAGGFTDVQSYDPFNPAIATLPERRFDLILSFETLEHVPDPLATVRQIGGHLKPDGGLFFSTLLQPEKGMTMDWWYASPRNGHISIFTREALRRLCGEIGLRCFSLNNNLHLATAGRADWLRHLFRTKEDAKV